MPARALAGLTTALALAGCASGLWPGADGADPQLVEAPAAELPAPEALRATSGEYRAIPLQWDPVLRSDVAGYVVERAGRRDGPFGRAAVVRGRGSMTHLDGGGADGLGDGATRFYRVRAFARDGRVASSASPVVVGTTAPPPDGPAGLRAFSRQPRQIPLRWQASEDPTVAGYALERSPAPEGPFEVVARLEGRHATGYVDRGLGDLRVLYYRISSYNRGGARGAPSDAVRAVTKPEPLPPVGLRLADQRLGTNLLVWDPNVEPDLGAYLVYRKPADGSPATLAATVGADQTSAEDASVGAGERHSYSVVAVDRDGIESAPSDPIDVEGLDYELSAEPRPEGLHLKWSAREDEGFHAARITRTAWFTRRRIEVVRDGHYVDREVKGGRRYRYVVVLLRPDGGEAPPSRPLEVEIPEGVGSR